MPWIALALIQYPAYGAILAVTDEDLKSRAVAIAVIHGLVAASWFIFGSEVF